MSVVQLVEQYLVHLLIATYELDESSLLTSSEYDQLLVHLTSATFGDLVRRLSTQLSLPLNFEQRLNEARTHRNLLAHGYFRQRVPDLLTATGRAEMVRELDAIGSRLHELYEYLDTLIVHWMQAEASTIADLRAQFSKAASDL